MKAHIGTDAASGLVHSVEGTEANVSDISQRTHCCTGKKKAREPTRATPAWKSGPKSWRLAARSNGAWQRGAVRSKRNRKAGPKPSAARGRNSRRGRGRWSSPRSTSSKTSSGIAKCDTGGWRKTRANCGCSSRWPTYTCCGGSWRAPPQPEQGARAEEPGKGCEKPLRSRKNRAPLCGIRKARGCHRKKSACRKTSTPSSAIRSIVQRCLSEPLS